MSDKISVDSTVEGYVNRLDIKTGMFRRFDFIGTVQDMRDTTWSWAPDKKQDTLRYIRTDQHHTRHYGDSDLVIHSELLDPPLTLIVDDETS